MYYNQCMEKGAINISANSTILPEAVLSNFFDSPISLFWKLYRSVESFWQAIKFPEWSEERDKVSRMTWWEAKNYIKKAWIHPDVLILNWEQIIAWSERHKELMKIALEAKFSHPALAKILQDTWDADITHILVDSSWKEHTDSLSMPRDVFCGFIKAIRQDLKNKTLNVPLSEAMLIRSKHAVLPIKRVKWVLNQILGDDSDEANKDSAIQWWVDRFLSIMKNRDKGILDLLSEMGIDLSEIFWIYWDVLLSRETVGSELSPELKGFYLDSKYNEVGSSKISSRGRGYYFNLNWFSKIQRWEKRSKPYHEIEPKVFYNEILEYFEKVANLVVSFQRIDENRTKNSLLFLLDHFRNILLFLRFQVLIFDDSENIRRILWSDNSENRLTLSWGKDSVDNLVESGFIWVTGDYSAAELDVLILQVEKLYLDTLFKKKGNLISSDDCLWVKRIIKSLEQKMIWINQRFSSSRTFLTRIILNTLRTFREADNPIKSLYAAMNFIATNDYQLRTLSDIQVVGIPYGSIEIPYIVKSLLEEIYPEKKGSIYIDFLVMPPLNYRWCKPFSMKEWDLKSSNIILVDDNISTGNTIIYAQGLLAHYAETFFHMVVEWTTSVNSVSVSVYDTICGFVPQMRGSTVYKNRLWQKLRNRWIIGRL